MASKKQKSSTITIPGDGLPLEVLDMVTKSSKPSKVRSISYESDKKNPGGDKKGIQKPGFISYEVLRRIVKSVPVARICINVLKQKVSKTKWVIKAIDPLTKIEESRIKELTELLKNPNTDDTWRSLLDKMLEDLLILDSVSVEKTRYPNGKLAQLHYVDASTIRPVFDEMGNQDIPIVLETKEGAEELPVSYLQIMDNSLYGGPESGEIVAAWAKKDMIYFHANPQGSMENYGYGLSPLEAVISTINALLNTENFNNSYFDTGAFPPVILQLAESLEQRQLEAYREYLYQEMAGDFHRPAIVAGGGEMKVHNLKDLSQRDMQFMEYTTWLAKIMCAIFGLSPQDIGLTDDVNRSTSETLKDLSDAKGYGNILDLLKDVINSNIVHRDFGYKELEFDWVQIDNTDPKTLADIHDLRLKNGTMTVNEVRQAMGLLPFDEWANQPLLLTGEGYKPIHFDDTENVDDDKEIGAETVYREDDDISKSLKKSIYTMDGYKTWVDDRGYGQPFIYQNIQTGQGMVIKPPIAVNLYSQNLEVELTHDLASKGFNVVTVDKMDFNTVKASFPTLEVSQEFDKYINMTPEYDSEKWRAKNGGSRKFSYYNVSKYIDGYSFNSRQVIENMKSDPTSYTQAIIDLANLWKIEKEMVLGDRRADQYIIDVNKRVWGFDYQFKGDKKRWEDNSKSIEKVLIQIPQLHKLFLEKISDNKVDKSLFKKALEFVKGALINPENPDINIDFENKPIMFGRMIDEKTKNLYTELMKYNELEGFSEIAYTYDWDVATGIINGYIVKNPNSIGFIQLIKEIQGVRYNIMVLDTLKKGSLVYSPKLSIDMDFEQNPMMFGRLINEAEKQKNLQNFKNKELTDFKELSYAFDWNTARSNLYQYVKKYPNSMGCIILEQSDNIIKYNIKVKDL